MNPPSAPSLTLNQPAAGYRFSQDSFLLAGFFRWSLDGPLADLCAGAGAVSIHIGMVDPTKPIVAVELDPETARMARQNATASGLLRYVAVAADVMTAESMFKGRPFAHVVSNPPYRKLGSGRLCHDPKKTMARHETRMTLAGLVAAASRMLRPGGTFSIIMIMERREEHLSLLSESGFGEVRFQPAPHQASTPARLFLSEAILGR